MMRQLSGVGGRGQGENPGEWLERQRSEETHMEDGFFGVIS